MSTEVLYSFMSAPMQALTAKAVLLEVFDY